MTTSLASYTLSQLTSDLLSLSGDVNQTRYSPALINDAINASIKLLVTKKGYTYLEKIAGVGPSIPSWAQFPLKGSLLGPGTPTYDATDYIEIRRVSFGMAIIATLGPTSFASAGYRLNKTTLAIEDMNHPNWRTQASTPARWAFYDGSTVAVFPQISPSVIASGYTPIISVGYVQQPALLSLASDTVDSRVPYSVQQYLKYASAAWLLSLDKSDTTSLNTAKLYQDTFEQLIGS